MRKAMIDDLARDSERREGDPLKNLWAAVVETALDDLKDRSKYYKGNCTGAMKAERRGSINFFVSEHSRLPWICTELGLDIDSIRERAAEIIKEDSKK